MKTMLKAAVTIVAIGIGVLVAFAVLTVLLDGLSNGNPPSYVKDVVAYSEGSDAFMVYFILADSSGNMTTSDGNVELTISETVYSYSRYSGSSESERVLYFATLDIKSTDFQRGKVGIGAFERDAVLYLLGRIPYSWFSRWPSESSGKVHILFQTPSGEVLEGEDFVIF